MRPAASSSTPAANIGKRRTILSGRRWRTGSKQRNDPVTTGGSRENTKTRNRSVLEGFRGFVLSWRHMTGELTPFRYYLRVRYIECDAQKVVFNSRYSEYVDVGINEFLRAAGVLSDFITGPLDFQLVKQTIEWKAPARFDQVLELSMSP